MNATLVDFVLPWVMAGVEDVVPIEQAGGIRSASLRLGTWRSPLNFPWEVSVVRTDWIEVPFSADGEPTREEAEPLVSQVPCLLLVPRPLALPKGNPLAEFRRWHDAVSVGNPGAALLPKPDEVRWRLVHDPPESLGDLWNDSVAHARSAGDVPEKRKARQAALKAVWDRTPWLFALSEQLLLFAAEEMKLPPQLDGTSKLLAARGARKSGWLSGDVPKRSRRAPLHWLRAGAYDVLLGHDVPSQLAAAFCDRADIMAPLNDSLTRGNYRSWERDLDICHNCPTLLPLPPDPAHRHIDDFPTWAMRWLTDGAQQALWFAFGRAQGHFRWEGVDGPEAKRERYGLRLLERGNWEPTIEAAPDKDYVGFRCRWSPAPEAPALAEPEHRGLR